jgi:fluoride ion exporter CrcB/FEX
MEKLLAVAIGGAIGSLARYIIPLFAQKVRTVLQGGLPLNARGYILVSNIVSLAAVVLGFIISQRMRL